jgi:hypothetical protein
MAILEERFARALTRAEHLTGQLPHSLAAEHLGSELRRSED